MKEREAFWLEIGKYFLATVVAAVTAAVTTTWNVRGILADYDRRISVLEVQQQTSDKAVTDKLDALRYEVRELRAAVLDNKRP